MTSKTIVITSASDYFLADFADLSQVRELADKIRSACPRIDVWGNNAGGVFSKPQRTADGHESTFQVNYVTPFLLTTLLLGMRIGSQATVVKGKVGKVNRAADDPILAREL